MILTHPRSHRVMVEVGLQPWPSVLRLLGSHLHRAAVSSGAGRTNSRSSGYVLAAPLCQRPVSQSIIPGKSHISWVGSSCQIMLVHTVQLPHGAITSRRQPLTFTKALTSPLDPLLLLFRFSLNAQLPRHVLSGVGNTLSNALTAWWTRAVHSACRSPLSSSFGAPCRHGWRSSPISLALENPLVSQLHSPLPFPSLPRKKERMTLKGKCTGSYTWGVSQSSRDLIKV